jgi:hypothetical protein
MRGGVRPRAQAGNADDRGHSVFQRWRLGGELLGTGRALGRPPRAGQLGRAAPFRSSDAQTGGAAGAQEYGCRRLMRILLVSDAWAPQVNGVVRTLQQVKSECEALGHRVEVISPDLFRTVPCPTYPRSGSLFAPAARSASRSMPFAPTACTSRLRDRSASRRGDNACAGVCRSRPPTTRAFPSTCTPASRSRSRSLTRGCVGFIAPRPR